MTSLDLTPRITNLMEDVCGLRTEIGLVERELVEEQDKVRFNETEKCTKST